MNTLFRFAGHASLALALTAARAPTVSMALELDGPGDGCGEAPPFDPAVLELAPGDGSEWEEECGAPEGTQSGQEVASSPERGAGAAV